MKRVIRLPAKAEFGQRRPLVSDKLSVEPGRPIAANLPFEVECGKRANGEVPGSAGGIIGHAALDDVVGDFPVVSVDALDMAGAAERSMKARFVGAVDLEFLEIGIALEKLLMVRNAIILVPFRRADQTVGQPADMSLPVSDQEVEIMCSVVLWSSLRQHHARRQTEEYNCGECDKSNEYVFR
jgi:hypothetical protein